jgi:hypothetical protein
MAIRRTGMSIRVGTPVHAGIRISMQVGIWVAVRI